MQTARRFLSSLIEGWPLALFAWLLFFGALTRGWRVGDAALGSDRPEEWLWLPKTLGVDAAFALLLWAAAAALAFAAGGVGGRGAPIARVAGRVAGVVGALFVLALGVANALSFRVSGSALTVQRLRGDDGATLRDLGLIDWGDAWPVLVLAAVALLSLVAAIASAPRLERVPRGKRARIAAAAAAASLLAFGAYEAAWDGHDRGYGRHPLGVLVDSALQEWLARPEALAGFHAPPASDAGWDALFTPDAPASPAPPPPARASSAPVKNVIVFLSEGVPLKHTSLDPHGPPTTPRLLARSKREGLVLDRLYSPYHRSIHALFSLLCGDYPSPEPLGITLLNPRIDCGEFSTSFAKAGVKSAFFHGGYFSFYDKMRFLGLRDYTTLEDASTLERRPGTWSNAWGVDDRAMVQRALAWIDAQPKDQRFALVLVPITAHYPFNTPDDVDEPFGTARKIDRFKNAVSFLDLAFDELMQGLDERGLLDDTAVLFTADHGESPFEPPRVTNVDRAAYEYDVHVPGVLFARSLFPTPQHTDRLAAIPDILPTLLDIAGVDDPYAKTRQGRSLLAPDWRERRVFVGAARSNVNEVGFLDGHTKYLLNTDTAAEEFYDLDADPDELDNAIDALRDKDPQRAARDREVALTYAAWQLPRIRDMKRIDEGFDIHELLARDWQVTVVDHDGKRTPCTPRAGGNPTQRTCPGYGDDVYGGVVPLDIRGEPRHCLAIAPPPGGAVELAVADKPYLSVVSMLQYGPAHGARIEKQVMKRILSVDVDGAPVTFKTRYPRYPRLPLPQPRSSLKITVADAAAGRPLCLFFSVEAWAPAHAQGPASVPDGDGDADDDNNDNKDP